MELSTSGVLKVRVQCRSLNRLLGPVEALIEGTGIRV